MSGEKIDLREIERDALVDLAHANIEETQTAASGLFVRRLRNRATRQLALVAAVRAARAYKAHSDECFYGCDDDCGKESHALDSALSPFTDSNSAEVPDGRS